MPRERRNAPPTRRQRSDTPGERVRRRLSASPEIELTDEELRALADEGIDPDDVRRLAREGIPAEETSLHDRDTARDAIEGMTLRDDDDY